VSVLFRKQTTLLSCHCAGRRNIFESESRTLSRFRTQYRNILSDS